MNQFKMSLFLPPISPVKDSATGRTVQPPTLTPYKEITLQEVYKLITSSERLKTLTETVRRAAENGDEKAYRMLKQQTLPYVTPCGVFSYRKSDSLTGPSGLIVVDIDHLDSREEAEKLKRQLNTLHYCVSIWLRMLINMALCVWVFSGLWHVASRLKIVMWMCVWKVSCMAFSL